MAGTADSQDEKTSTFTQTVPVSSDILWQCIFVIKKEFRNLDYRVTNSQKGQEMVVVYRNDAFGVFGPPLDPITLTLDTSGHGLLAVLFKPVQRVSFVSQESGCIEVNSLLTLLKLVSGKGFYFCPGIPEQYLAGKAFSKNVTLHKLPFKRYQAFNCPIYYQSPPLQQKSPKSSFLSICPRCLAAAALVHPLPSHNYVHKHPVSLKVDIPKDIQSVYAGELTLDKKGGSPAVHPPGSQAFASLQVDNELQKAVFALPSRNSSILDMSTKTNGLSGRASAEISKCDALVDRLKSGTSSLRSMLQEKYKKKTLAFPDESIQAVKIETSKIEKEKKAKCNVCRQCKKQFSTPAALLNHLQRHEGLTGSWKSRLRSKKQDPVYTSTSSLLRMLARNSNSQGGQKGKKNSPAMSKSALKLVVKYLDALIPSMNGVSAVKKNIKLDSDIPVGQNSSILVSPSEELSRPSSGFDAVQSLLDAAALTGNGLDDLNTSSSSGPGRKRRAVAAVLPVPQPSTDDTWPKKARKSTRLASKKSKDKQPEPVSEGSTSQDTTLLRNLDLLSTVSLNLCSSSSNPVTTHVNSYASPQPLSSATGFSSIDNHRVPYSNTVTVLNNFLNDASLGSNILNKSLEAPLNISAGVKLPPVPPLIFAGMGHGQPVSGYGQPAPLISANVQAQYSVNQTALSVTSSPPILQNLVSVGGASSSGCGAIDLSKPKQYTELCPNIPHELKIGTHLRHDDNHIEKEDPKEVLKCIMLMSKTAPAPAVQPAENVSIDKRSDSNLQARMFASARNYKVDKKSQSVPQVQAVIASTSRIVQGGVKGSRGNGAATQGDEIQCGYKWSGSGGLVKERTQLVRELVPLEVMTSLLSRAPLSLPGSSAINLASPTQTQQHAMATSPQHQQIVMANSSSPVQSLAAPSVALNLTTTKPNHIPSPKRGGPGRPRKSAGNSFNTLPQSTWLHPAPDTKSILRSSLMQASDRASSQEGLPHKSSYSFNNCVPSLNSTPSPASATPPKCHNSSPSLSAMLRQPAFTNHSDYSGYSAIDPATLQVSSPLAKGFEIKPEPLDFFSQPSQDRIIMALPIKAEEPGHHRGSQLVVDDDESCSQNLVMDIR